MDKETFSFRLDCASDAVTPKALSQSVTIFTKMLAEANASDWRISRMELHSVDLAAQPIVSDAAAEESFAVLEVIARLATDNAVSRERASRFATILSTMNDLSKDTGANIVVTSRGEEGAFTPLRLADVNRLLVRSARRSFGHVRGRVDKIILQSTHRALGLVDCVTQSRIDVKFGSDLDADVKQIRIGMDVDVRGFIRSSEGKLLSMEAEEVMIVHEGHHSPVTADDLEGTIDLGFTGGLGSLEFVSALRDGNVLTGGEE